MFKRFVAFAVPAFAFFFAGCSSPVSSVNDTPLTGPAAGVYYLAPCAQYQMPQAFIWDGGTSWRVGSESDNVISIRSCLSFEGDSIANLELKHTDGTIFTGRAIRLPVSVAEYTSADSLHPFNGLYGTHDDSYVISIIDTGVYSSTNMRVGSAKIISVKDGAIGLRGTLATNFYHAEPKLVLAGRGWGEITLNPIAPQLLTGLLQWGSIQLVGMDACGR